MGALKSPTVRPIARVVQSIPSILVAEDSRSQRALVVGLLRSEGLEVHEAADGRVALDLCRIAQPDLLLLDLALPRLQGWEVLARVRSDSKLRTMPVIVMTADTEADTVTAVLPDAGPSRAAEAAEALRTAGANQPVVIDGLTVPVTVSVGWACGSDIAPDRLIELADAALYQAKKGGRNRVRAAS